MAYSLIGSARSNGLDPEHYLRYVLEHIADHPISQIQQLLPWNVPLSRTSIVDGRDIHITTHTLSE
jgi:transposase